MYPVPESKYLYLFNQVYFQFYVILDAICFLVLGTSSLNNAISLNKV
jgi:hypothetical protein